jgi:hypothetical protein
MTKINPITSRESIKQYRIVDPTPSVFDNASNKNDKYTTTDVNQILEENVMLRRQMNDALNMIKRMWDEIDRLEQNAVNRDYENTQRNKDIS